MDSRCKVNPVAGLADEKANPVAVIVDAKPTLIVGWVNFSEFDITVVVVAKCHKKLN